MRKRGDIFVVQCDDEVAVFEVDEKIHIHIVFLFSDESFARFGIEPADNVEHVLHIVERIFSAFAIC